MLSAGLVLGIYMLNTERTAEWLKTQSSILERTTRTKPTSTTPSWSQYYCQVNPRDDSADCRSILLTEYLELSPNSNNESSKSAWYFLGDSQMGHLFKEIVAHYPHAHSSVKMAEHKCGFLKYAGFERSETWTYPNWNLTEGPIVNGYDMHWCSDLDGWDNMMVRSDVPIVNAPPATHNISAVHNHTSIGNNVEKNKFIEYLVVEFAKDVEQQTPTTTTTQETAVAYIQSHDVPPSESVCVVNTGLHDLTVWHTALNVTDGKFFENVQWYLEQLATVCGTIIWVGLSSVRGDVEHPQQNSVMKLWNAGIYDIIGRMEEFEDGGAFVVDVWDHSMTATRRDNVHYQVPYYDHIAKLFTSFM